MCKMFKKYDYEWVYKHKKKFDVTDKKLVDNIADK